MKKPMSKRKTALNNVPEDFRVLDDRETVVPTDWLWTNDGEQWIQADFVIGECKASDFICVIREELEH